MPRPRPLSKVLPAAVCLALAFAAAACGGKAKPANGGGQASTGGGSQTSTSATSSGTNAAGGTAQVYVYYYQDMPTHVAELAKMGLDLFPQPFTQAKMTVHVQSIPGTGDVAGTLTGLVAQDIGNNAIIVCACPSVPASLTNTKAEGYPFVQTSQKENNFYYSELGSMTEAMVADPFWSAIEAIQGQVAGKGQTAIAAYIAQNFGDSPSRAGETYDSLAGKPVNASVTDLQVQEIDFYPFLGWSPTTEYITQVVSVANVTENSVSSLSFPLLPGATDVHSGFWGPTTPPFTGQSVTPGSDGQVTLPAPIAPFTAANLAVTYSVGVPSGDQWRSFTWSLPFPAKNLEIKLFNYYAQQGDTVSTDLKPVAGDPNFQIWGAQNLPQGQSITFTAATPGHAPLGSAPLANG